MRFVKSRLCLYLFFAASLQPLYGAEAESAALTPTLTESPRESRPLRTGLAVSGGCVGGAVLGTVVPIFGNLVGCVLGGFTGWWLGRDQPVVATDRPPQPTL